MSDDYNQRALKGLSDALQDTLSTEPSNGSIKDRLRLVEPRSTYVIECSRIVSTDELIGYRNTILGPFTKREADAVAATITCKHRVLAIDTQPPDWATS